MATRNQLDAVLSGTTGTGTYVGTNSPTLVTPALGTGTGTSINIASSQTISSFINDNTFATSSSSSGATSSSIKAYIDANQIKGKLIQYSISTSTTNDSTTSASMQNSSLSGSITPTSASNIIVVYASYYARCGRNTGSNQIRSMSMEIYRSSGTPAVITSGREGRDLIGNSTSQAYSYGDGAIIGSETAPSTASHTYVLRYAIRGSGTTAEILGFSAGALTMVIFELKV